MIICLVYVCNFYNIIWFIISERENFKINIVWECWFYRCNMWFLGYIVYWFIGGI